MGLWNCCEVCGESIETGQPCIGVKEESKNLCGSSICMNCAKIENLSDGREPVSITDLLARAEAAEERCKELEERCKRLDEAMGWAKYASGTWERAYYNALERAERAEHGKNKGNVMVGPVCDGSGSLHTGVFGHGHCSREDERRDQSPCVCHSVAGTGILR